MFAYSIKYGCQVANERMSIATCQCFKQIISEQNAVGSAYLTFSAVVCVLIALETSAVLADVLHMRRTAWAVQRVQCKMMFQGQLYLAWAIAISKKHIKVRVQALVDEVVRCYYGHLPVGYGLAKPGVVKKITDLKCSIVRKNLNLHEAWQSACYSWLPTFIYNTQLHTQYMCLDTWCFNVCQLSGVVKVSE